MRTSRDKPHGASLAHVEHRTHRTLAVVIMLAVAGCGTDDAPASRGGSDGGSGGGSPPDAGEDDGGPPYTLEDVCERTSRKLCTLRQPCCAGRYEEAGCMTRAQADCVKDVEDVRAGGSTFRPERIAPCLAKTASLLASCPKATFDVFYQLVADAAGCQTFEGSRPQAAACERDSQCKPSTSPTELVFCAGAPKTCTMFRLLPAGAACKIGGGDLCAKGLFCDADFALMPPIGTCKAITPLGSACDAAKAINLACGPSNYCDKSTAKCAAGKDEGACQVDAECATGVCLPTSKTCKRLDPLLKTEDCRGF